MRFVQLTIKPDSVLAFERFYNFRSAPALLEVEGCLFAHLIQSDKSAADFISFTVSIWDGKDYADFYERSGKFEELFSILRPMLSSLYQWKMTLEPRDRARTHSSDDVSVEGYNALAGVEI